MGRKPMGCPICRMPDEERAEAERVLRGEERHDGGKQVSASKWCRDHDLYPNALSYHRITCLGMPKARGGRPEVPKLEGQPKPHQIRALAIRDAAIAEKQGAEPEELADDFKDGKARPWLLNRLHDAIVDIDRQIENSVDQKGLAALYTSRLQHIQFALKEVGGGSSTAEKQEAFRELLKGLNPNGVELKRVTETVTLKREADGAV